MYVLACIPIYSDRWRDSCCDPVGSQESAPEVGLGCELPRRRQQIALLTLTNGQMTSVDCPPIPVQPRNSNRNP
jgi:hypothetical protein